MVQIYQCIEQKCACENGKYDALIVIEITHNLYLVDVVFFLFTIGFFNTCLQMIGKDELTTHLARPPVNERCSLLRCRNLHTLLIPCAQYPIFTRDLGQIDGRFVLISILQLHVDCCPPIEEFKTTFYLCIIIIIIICRFCLIIILQQLTKNSRC